jgi:hypothetical protein
MKQPCWSMMMKYLVMLKISTALRRLANPVAARENGIAAVDGGTTSCPRSIACIVEEHGTEVQRNPTSPVVVDEQDMADY